MNYKISKVVSYVVFDEKRNIINEFADYDEAYKWAQEAELKEMEGAE